MGQGLADRLRPERLVHPDPSLSIKTFDMIVLLGGSGFVGTALRASLARHEVEFATLRRHEIDLHDVDALAGRLSGLGAKFLINSAGYTGRTNVDDCERDKAECLSANAVLPGKIRAACERAGIPWGQVSSGCLYNGDGGKPGGFTESDPPNFCFRDGPCSFYSGTKALAEEVLADCPTCYLWRPRMPLNHEDSPRNYLSKLQRYDRLLDATNSLSHLDDFADAAVQCWIRRVPFGIYNVVNTGAITTRRVTELIQERLPRTRPYRFFTDEAEFMRSAAETPRSSCVLDNSKLASTGIPMRPVEDAIVASLENWQVRQSD